MAPQILRSSLEWFYSALHRFHILPLPWSYIWQEERDQQTQNIMKDVIISECTSKRDTRLYMVCAILYICMYTYILLLYMVCTCHGVR